MYALQESLIPEEFQHNNRVINITHKFCHNEDQDLMVVITTFKYDFFDFDGPSISTGYEGKYSGKSMITLAVDIETAKVDVTSIPRFADNHDFMAILEEVKTYYDLLLQISDSANQFIVEETIKPVQIKFNMLNKEDYKLYSALTGYINNIESNTLSAGLRSIMNFGFRVHDHGVRVSPTNKVYLVKEMPLTKSR
ncbi:MAG: hypothetical protein K2Y14_02035 [Burkholderiales bacterium]|nr:hypothetical protein [Burkholderiales bacterium]